MRRLLTGLLGASLLLGACSDDGDDDRAAVTSIPDQTSSTTTTEKPAVPPPDVIPTDTSLITEEYVEQVANRLLQVTNRALLLTKDAGVVTENAIAIVEAATTENMGTAFLNELIALAAADFEGVVERPSGLTVSVMHIVEVTRDCVLAEVTIDRSGVAPSQSVPAGLRDFVQLRAASPQQRESGLNPTAWTLEALPGSTDGSAPSGVCV